MVKLKRIVTVFLSSLCLVLGYIFAEVSYDFDNYAGYISRSSLTADRFASEPAFVWLSWLLNATLGDIHLATRVLYGIAAVSLSLGVLRFGYAVKYALKVRSHYIVPVCFVVAMPLLALIAIVPRQCLASGLSFMAMAAYAESKGSNKAVSKYVWAKIVVLFLFAMLFHNLSTILAFCLFAWLFFRWPAILVSTMAMILILPLILLLVGGGLKEVVPAIGSAMVYLMEANRQTGVYRLIVFLLVAGFFFLSVRRYSFRAGVFGGNPKLRVGLLAGIAVAIYFFVSPDVVRALYYPTIVIWLFAGVSIVKRGLSGERYTQRSSAF